MKTGRNEYRCFVVDDNQIDRLTTVSFVKKFSFLKMGGMFNNAEEAMEMSGLDLRRKLAKVPACIFITAYPEYAIQGFDANALDFLVKPIDDERFDVSMERLQYYLDIHYKADLLDHSLNEDSLFIKDGHEHIKIQFYDIVYLEALKDYTGIVTKDRKYCVLTPLGNLLKEKAFQSFVRIHRSYAVQKHFIRKVTPKAVMVNQVLLPVGRSYKEALDSLLTQ